jgi:hypothetical protein
MTPDITLADAITALVAEKRAVGYKYCTEARVLARFEAFCRAQFPGLGTLTQVSVEAWIASARRRGVTPATLQGLAAPVRELARWLGRRGAQTYVLPAGVLRTAHRCGNPGCHCHADPPQLHGPYLTWTRKVDNKTVTRTLDPAQAEQLRPLLDNSRRLRELVSEFEALALQQVENDPAQPDP